MSRKLIYLVSSVLLLGLVLTNTASAGEPNAGDPNLVGWWKLDEPNGTIAYDSSGNNLNGTLVGNPIWVPGKINGALQLDGKDDWVDCGYNAKLVIRDRITMACWIKVAQLTVPWEAFIARGDNSYRISSSQSGSTIHMGLTGTSVGFFDGTKSVGDNKWHHIAGVYDGSQAMIYIDGQLDIAKTCTGRIYPTKHNLYIGANQEQPSRMLTGLIDDVRLYNRALTQKEIQVIMSGG